MTTRLLVNASAIAYDAPKGWKVSHVGPCAGDPQTASGAAKIEAHADAIKAAKPDAVVVNPDASGDALAANFPKAKIGRVSFVDGVATVAGLSLTSAKAKPTEPTAPPGD